MLTETIDQTLELLLRGEDADGEDEVVLLTGVLGGVDNKLFVDRGQQPRSKIAGERGVRIPKRDKNDESC